MSAKSLPGQETFRDVLRLDGVTDEAVLAAMEAVPREAFVAPSFGMRAYENRPLPIDCAQTISQPTVVGLMTQALRLDPRCKVLEIGAGSGYQTAILARLARRVYALERHAPLATAAQERLQALGVSNAMVVHGDGMLGWERHAPFDRILVAAAAPDIPPALTAQLAEGGILVLPVGEEDEVQQLLTVEKTRDGLSIREMIPARFVPMLPGTE